MFNMVKIPQNTETIKIDQLEVVVTDAMSQAFSLLQRLQKYFKSTPYLDSDRDLVLRERVLEALTQAGYLKDRLDGGPRSPLVLEPASDPKNTLTSGTADLDYNEKLSKLQRKIEKFEAYVEEKDKTILEQETQLSELQDQVHEAIKIEEGLRGSLKEKGKQVDELQSQLKSIKDTHDRHLREL